MLQENKIWQDFYCEKKSLALSFNVSSSLPPNKGLLNHPLFNKILPVSKLLAQPCYVGWSCEGNKCGYQVTITPDKEPGGVSVFSAGISIFDSWAGLREAGALKAAGEEVTRTTGG